MVYNHPRRLQQQLSRHRDPRLIQQNLKTVVDTAATALEAGATAREVVIHAVTALEDFPLFNAGKGSALTAEGDYEVTYPQILP